MPPALLISSKVKSSTSRKEVSLIAMVPLREWRMPTLIVSAREGIATAAARLNRSSVFFRRDVVFFMVCVIFDFGFFRFSILRAGSRHAIRDHPVTAHLTESVSALDVP